MKKNFLRAAFVAALMSTASVTGMAMTTTPAQAADQLSKDVAVDLKAAQDALTAKDIATAAAQIKAAQALADRTPFDDFTINRFLSAVAAQQQDYATAATAYDAFIAAPFFNNLKPEEQKAAYHDATIVSQNAQHWSKVIEYGQKLEAMQGLDDLTETMIAIAYFQTKDNTNALKYAQMAVAAAKAEGKEPQPNATIIIGNIEGKSDPDAARRAIETLILSSNNPDDWGKLIDDALSHKGTKSIDALFLFRLRNAVGMVDDMRHRRRRHPCPFCDLCNRVHDNHQSTDKIDLQIDLQIDFLNRIILPTSPKGTKKPSPFPERA